MSGGSTVFTSVVGYGLRRLARAMSEGFGNKGEVSQSRHYRDPAQQSGLNLHSFFMGPLLAQGVITDSTALGHCYRVQLEKGHFPIICTVGGIASYSAAGVRDLTTIQPGTRVVVMHHPQTYYGVIICTIPSGALSSKQQLHSILNHATRNRVDEGHKQPFKQGGRGFAASFTSGRPFDSTTGGEKGFISETGIRVFIDSFMAQLAVDESCGITAFYHDQLLRIAAYNLRMFSAGMEREGIDDQEEYNDWTGYTPYPWEQMGMYERADPRREYEPKDWQLGVPYYGVWEPTIDKQKPWHREREYHGYLGQGGKHTVKTKPKSAPDQALFLTGGIQYPGLADDSTQLHGLRTITSAKGISIVKRAAIQAPSRLYMPEQIKDEGDSPNDYKASGIVGEGPEHIIHGEIEPQGTPQELNRALGVLDLHAYWFNYGTFHPFFYHAKDWDVFSEDNLLHTNGTTIKIPEYDKLASSVFLKAPDPIEIEIDHRYKKVKYWQNECGVDFLEDGGLSLYDGWGSELRMTAGSAWLSAPGDVWINPGRNVNIWGADDVNIRARNSCDIVTSNGDIRLKSERNLHMLSGNSGIGGTLIECRAPDKFNYEGCGEDVISGGVFLRSEYGTVGGWATNVYWRVGGPDIAAGVLFLDSDAGGAPIVTNSNVIMNYVDQAVFWHLNCSGGDCSGPSAYVTESGTGWPGFMCNPDNGAIFGGPGIFDGSVMSTQAFVAVACPFVSCLTGDAMSAVSGALSSCKDLIHETIPEIGSVFYKKVLDPLFYEEDKPGNDWVIFASEFSLRTVEQYGTEDFALYEMRWQQMGRKAGMLQGEWKENSVECANDPTTYPYPGKENFQGDKYYEQDPSLFEIQGTQGRAKNHGTRPDLASPYQDPIYGVITPKSLEKIKVILTPTVGS